MFDRLTLYMTTFVGGLFIVALLVAGSVSVSWPF
jgi:hypothetical protein